MVTLGRFELPTCGLGNRRSIHLSYRAMIQLCRSSFGKPPDLLWPLLRAGRLSYGSTSHQFTTRLFVTRFPNSANFQAALKPACRIL